MTDKKTNGLIVENPFELNMLFAKGIFLPTDEIAALASNTLNVVAEVEIPAVDEAKAIPHEEEVKTPVLVGVSKPYCFFLNIEEFRQLKGVNPEEVVAKIVSILTVKGETVKPHEFEVADIGLLEGNNQLAFPDGTRKIVMFTNHWNIASPEIASGNSALLFKTEAIRFSNLTNILADVNMKKDFAEKLRMFFQ